MSSLRLKLNVSKKKKKNSKNETNYVSMYIYLDIWHVRINYILVNYILVNFQNLAEYYTMIYKGT